MWAHKLPLKVTGSKKGPKQHTHRNNWHYFPYCSKRYIVQVMRPNVFHGWTEARCSRNCLSCQSQFTPFKDTLLVTRQMQEATKGLCMSWGARGDGGELKVCMSFEPHFISSLPSLFFFGHFSCPSVWATRCETMCQPSWANGGKGENYLHSQDSVETRFPLLLLLFSGCEQF